MTAEWALVAVAGYAAGAIITLAWLFRSARPAPPTWDEHVDTAMRAARGRHPSTLRCLVCNVDVPTDMATHSALWHSPRPLGVEDRADWTP